MRNEALSIIVPVLNEEDNIYLLVESVESEMRKNSIDYELIFIDDYSNDNTKRNIIKSSSYPVSYYEKNGPKGKGYSILQGLNYAKYPVVSILDADLQYLPKYLIPMLGMISKETDIVVANRVNRDSSSISHILNNLFEKLLNKRILKMNVDINSSLKMFKKDITDRLKLSSLSNTFDIDLLVKSKEAGYNISTFDIIYHKRYWNKSKFNFFSAVKERSLRVLKYKFSLKSPIPFSQKELDEEGIGFHYKGKRFMQYTPLSHKDSALYTLTRYQKLLLLSALFLLILSLILNTQLTLAVLISIVTIFYFVDLLFNIFLVYRSFFKKPEIKVKRKELENISEWPIYTIFCPLYHEYNVVPQFIRAIGRIDYPKDKLQAILLLEEDDLETISRIQHMDLPSYFEIAIIPDSFPKTKPKALNYGLKKARGEYIVIYDAEDKPDIKQLKKAVIAFGKLDKKTICIQAKLNYYNTHQNFLTKLFTAEYTLWFDLILPGLQSISAPIPLGGTSNHFRTKDILSLKGWDPFNVTEDADLGMRIAKLGFKTAMMDSTTREEANSVLKSWVKQRSRWVKGYMQTYLVHTRNVKHFLANGKNRRFFLIQLILGTKVVSLLINPFMWAMTISYFLFRPIIGSYISKLFISPILYIAVLTLILGNFMYIYCYILGMARRGHWALIKYTLLIPFYWLMMSIAAFYALWELIVRPYYWNKTKHGLYLNNSVKISTSKILNTSI